MEKALVSILFENVANILFKNKFTAIFQTLSTLSFLMHLSLFDGRSVPAAM